MNESQRASLVHRICFSILKKRIKQMNEIYRPHLRAMTEEELIAEFKRFCT